MPVDPLRTITASAAEISVTKIKRNKLIRGTDIGKESSIKFWFLKSKMSGSGFNKADFGFDCIYLYLHVYTYAT